MIEEAQLAALCAMIRHRPQCMPKEAPMLNAALGAKPQLEQLIDMIWMTGGAIEVARMLAKPLSETNRSQGADIQLAISRNIDAISDDHRNAGFSLQALGRGQDALECWERCAISNPSDPDAVARINRLRPQAIHENARMRVQSKLRRPSFAYKVAEQIRLDNASLNDPMFSLARKEVNHPWASNLGIRTARRICRISLAELVAEHLPQSFVVKPTNSHSSRGVFLLRRVGESFNEMQCGAVKSLDAWKVELEGIAGQYDLEDDWFVEELLTASDGRDEPPDAVDFYAFFGRIGCIYLRRSSGANKRTRWFDSDWHPIDAGPTGDTNDNELPIPKSARELFNIAKQLSENISRPFMRIDLNDALGGPAFGECTPHPGWYAEFTDAWDRKLGELWEDADLRLRHKAIPVS